MACVSSLPGTNSTQGDLLHETSTMKVVLACQVKFNYRI